MTNGAVASSAMDGLRGISMVEARIGIAGWSIPSALASRFPEGNSHLERYAQRFNCVEINS